MKAVFETVDKGTWMVDKKNQMMISL